MMLAPRAVHGAAKEPTHRWPGCAAGPPLEDDGTAAGPPWDDAAWRPLNHLPPEDHLNGGLQTGIKNIPHAANAFAT